MVDTDDTVHDLLRGAPLPDVADPYDLAGPAYDTDSGPGAPVRSYVLCSMPRSGSTLLAEALHSTGVAGTPIEYFDRTNAFALLYRRWGCTGIGDYIERMHQLRCTPDKLFGTKLHWFQLEELTAEMARTGLVEVAAGDERALTLALGAVAPHATYVLVRRRETDRQAVSWFIAESTRRWSSLMTGPDGGVRCRGVPDFDLDAIEQRVRRLEEGGLAWERLVRSMGGQVLTVVYEDLTADYERTVRRVAERIGITLGAAPLPPPRLRRQADERSEAMVERFRAERGVDRRRGPA
jgi:trehalose 2-sulfotransferase